MTLDLNSFKKCQACGHVRGRQETFLGLNGVAVCMPCIEKGVAKIGNRVRCLGKAAARQIQRGEEADARGLRKRQQQ